MGILIKKVKYEVEIAQWEDKTATFTDDQRHYNGKYLAKCNVIDECVEYSYFKGVDKGIPDEIYINFGIMFGTVKTNRKDGSFLYKLIRDDILNEYERYGTDIPGDYINEFSEKYKIDIPNDIFFSPNPIDLMLNGFFDDLF